MVEFTNRGLRFRQPFTPGSQFYMSTGPYDFQNARYYLVNGWGHNGLGSVTVPKARKSSTKEIGETDEEWTDAQPMEVEEPPPEITIKIMDEGGKKPAPKGILPGTTLKLKAVPSQGSGTFSWKSKSKAIRIENADNQVVSLSVVAGQQEAPSGEVIELVYTPSGRSALSPVTHTVSVIKVLIMKNDAHAYG